MENETMKQCPFCAEEIKSEAIKCRWCGSVLSKDASQTQAAPRANYWRRTNEGKRVAGVCSGIANEFANPKLILPLRLFFILTTIFYGFGSILYVILWILMPPSVDTIVRPSAAGPLEKPVNTATTVTYHKKTDPFGMLLGFMIIAVGFVLILPMLSIGGFFDIPRFGIMPHMYNMMFFDIGWITGLLPILILVGLLLLFFGAIKFLRVAVGCGLVAVGTVFILMFTPIMPKLLILPGLIILGGLLILIGGFKLLFGSTKVVPQEHVVPAPPVRKDTFDDDEWNPQEGQDSEGS